MLSNFKNFLILKNNISKEEHLGRIEYYDPNKKKIILQLIDEDKNLTFKKGSIIDVLIPANEDLFKFKATIIYYDIIERFLSVSYPDEIEVLHRRKEKRHPLKLLMEIKIGESIIESISFDISLSGLSFISKTDKIVQIDDYVQIKIKLEKSHIDDLWLKVLNKREINYMGENYILYGGEFEDLSLANIDEIILLLNNNKIKLID